MTHTTTHPQEEVIDTLLLAKHRECNHQFYVCVSVADYQNTHDIPCPVCQPHYRFQDDDIFPMVISLSANDEPNGKNLLACGSCHDELCPNCTGHR